VVHLDQHVVRHHARDQVAAELGEPHRVALLAGRVGGHALVGERLRDGVEVGEHGELTLAERAHLLTLAAARAGPGLDVGARLETVEDVDEGALGAALERRTGERVVRPMGHEHAAHAEPLVFTQAAVDVLLRALRLPVLQAAAEEVGGLDADDHGQLAARDRATSLRRAVHQPEPALAGTAALGIYVVLQPA
jgi:hypothetical protein